MTNKAEKKYKKIFFIFFQNFLPWKNSYRIWISQFICIYYSNVDTTFNIELNTPFTHFSVTLFYNFVVHNVTIIKSWNKISLVTITEEERAVIPEFSHFKWVHLYMV